MFAMYGTVTIIGCVNVRLHLKARESLTLTVMADVDVNTLLTFVLELRVVVEYKSPFAVQVTFA